MKIFDREPENLTGKLFVAAGDADQQLVNMIKFILIHYKEYGE